MKKKFIIQIKRRQFWEDVLAFYDEKQAFSYYLRLRDQDIRCRLLEVYCFL